MKHEEMVLKEIAQSHVLEVECLCVNAGFVGKEDEQPSRVVKEEDKDS